MSHSLSVSARPRQAIVLAAGLGTRLGPFTVEIPKCLLPVAGRTILQRAIGRLQAVGIEQLLIVTGYKAEVIRDFVHKLDSPLRFQFIHNADYATTNNIYSFHLAAEHLRPPFLLLESDLIFGPGLLPGLLPACAASLSPLDESMNGTVVTLDPAGRVDGMYLKNDPRPDRPLYKTVNLYSFDAPTWEKILRPRFQAAVGSNRKDCYYEAIFAQAIRDGALTLRGAVCPATDWHEIDTPEDLAQAEAAMGK